MRRKSTACRIVPALFLVAIVMLLHVTVWAQETTLTTVVPSSHTLHIEVTGNGTIVVDEVAYTKTADVQVQRQHRPEVSIQAANDSKIKTVLWGSEDITAAFQDGKWIAPEITENAVLTVTFEKISSTPQTGDSFHPVSWFGLQTFSMLGLAVCLRKRKTTYA
ncbi:MAG: hypothetical protein E7437_05345 [Ruminococcaceae bacterium]|nr:hypothetical protein [Oscillospiraceae bacterium]